MQSYKLVAILLTILIALSFLLPNASWSQQYQEINGEVLDENNNPISSVEVKIYRENRKLDDTFTDPKGNYKLKFEKGKPIDTLSYYHTDWNPSTIASLSGARDHKINKALYKIGSKLSESARLEVILSIERLITIDLANNIPRDKVIKKYERAMANVGAKVVFVGEVFELRWEKRLFTP